MRPRNYTTNVDATAATAVWALAGLLAPFVLIETLYSAGIYLNLSAYHIWVLSLPLGGYLAYRSYKQGPAAEPATVPVQGVALAAANARTQPLSGAAYAVAALLGAALGLGGGYLTRPTFLGQKVPLQILTARVDETFAQIRNEFIAHLVLAAGIGLVAALALTFLVASLRKA